MQENYKIYKESLNNNNGNEDTLNFNTNQTEGKDKEEYFNRNSDVINNPKLIKLNQIKTNNDINNYNNINSTNTHKQSHDSTVKKISTNESNEENKKDLFTKKITKHPTTQTHA